MRGRTRICFKDGCRRPLPKNKRIRYCKEHRPRNGAFYRAKAAATV